MSREKIRLCRCSQCQEDYDHPDKEYHRQINLFAAQLNARQRRWFAALESSRIGIGGVQLVSSITGISTTTIHQGRKEFANAITELPKAISAKRRAGRPPAEKKQPTLEGELERLIANDIAGDPMTDQKWVRVSLRSLSRQLNEKGLSAAPTTVRRILRKMGFSLRANFKKKNGVRANYPERDEQFNYIAALRDQFTARSLPIISVDTKKKELIGDFKKSGRSWRRTADEVNEHDFLSIGVCRAVPYGIYDVNKNLGYVIVGISNDTPRFAVDAIALWWESEARQQYPNADELLILADGGGSNGFRSRAWKYQLQTELSNKFRIKISVCHYPPGCSKWNPVEHRLFSFISINWAGQPLRSLDLMMGYIRGTSTSTGLSVKALLLGGCYEKGQKVFASDFNHLDLRPHAILPEWNYTIYPRHQEIGHKKTKCQVGMLNSVIEAS